MKKQETISISDAIQLNPLVLAFVGDSVMALYVREKVVTFGFKVNKLNKLVNEKVNAKAQCDVFLKLEEDLTEEEQSVAQRARNTNMHHMAKNFSVMEYRYATALEAVIGFLYLTGQEKRLNEILERCV